MLLPLTRPRRTVRAATESVPPPVGGWNGRDALDQMEPSDAVKLDNWFPRESFVESRYGYASYRDTGEAAVVETVAQLLTGSAQKLIAGVNGKLLDMTTGTPSSLATGLSLNRWQHTNFRGRIFLVNGTDAPRDWDGTTLTSTAWSGSGLTIANLIDVLAFKNRLFFVEKNSQKLWYAGLQNVTGTLTAFDLSEVGNFGGSIVCIGAINQDGGDGPDDLLAIVMSSGEVIVYWGTDPGDATAWNIAGVYRIGAPVNRRAIARVGSDLCVVTVDGYVSLRAALAVARTDRKPIISDKIGRHAREAAWTWKDNFGWDVLVYPKGPMLIVNVPQGGGFVQHVMNLTTGAWCRFTGIPARCWTLYGDDALFGGAGGIIYKMGDHGQFSDAGAAIVTDAQTAWNYMGDRARLKSFKLAQPILSSEGDPGVSYALGVDFNPQEPNVSLPAVTASTGAEWNVDEWDSGEWGGSHTLSKNWSSVGGLGYCASLRLRTTNTAKNVEWNTTRYIFEPGAIY